MSNRAPSRSFNTVKHSNRVQRAKRQMQGRIVLLSICVVIILILLSLAVFLFCSLAHSIGSEQGTETPSGENPPQSKDIVYQQVTKSKADIGKGYLIVVSEKSNQKYTYPAIALTDMGYKQNGVNVYQTLQAEQMETTAAAATNRFLSAFYDKFKDNSLIFYDSYRTQKQQSGYSTPAGYSEHETGLVFGLNTYNADNQRKSLEVNANYVWLYDNCDKYGLICRYPDGKEDSTGVSNYNYCFRYVGVAHATYITQHDLSLEEYISLLKTKYAGDNHLLFNGADGNPYEVYYVPASDTDITTVSVPKNCQYTISGDNASGYIITMDLSTVTE